MTSSPLRRALRCALALAAVSAVAPSVAHASTWTVDDDRAQCPNAAFTSIQAAVDQAAPWDTVVVCDGDYGEASVPTSGTRTPSQPGSMNGLTITKPLTIKGAGADKVTIHPAASLGTTLAGTAPFLRDGGGNVITVSRQSLGSTDDNENFVSISGVTVTSPTAYVEAGIAFFNTSGRVADSVVGPLAPVASDPAALAARPHGYGIIATNSLQGGLGTVRREVTVANSLVTGYQAGGVRFDDGTGPDGAATNTTYSGIDEYGYVTNSKIVGSAAAARISPQVGVTYAAGARGEVTGSDIERNTYGGNTHVSAGIMLTDAGTGPDPSTPSGQAFSATGNDLANNAYGLLNMDATNTDASAAIAQAPGNWWGCTTGPIFGRQSTAGVQTFTVSSASTGCGALSATGTGVDSAANVAFAPFLTTPPAVLSAPAPVADAPPSVRIAEPATRPTIAVGTAIEPVVQAGDDLGVRSVTLTANGAVVGTVAHTPYEFTWTPTADQAGTTVSLVATATDSSGQTTSTSALVDVAGAPGGSPAGGGGGGGTAGGGGASAPSQTAVEPPAPEAPSAPTPQGSTPPAPAAPPSGRTVGSAVLSVKRGLVASARTKRLTLGRVTCVAGGGSCRLTLTGTVRVAGKAFPLRVQMTIPEGRAVTLSPRMAGGLLAALRHGTGRLTFKATVTTADGTRATSTFTATVRRS